MKTSFQAQEVRRTGLIRVLESDEAANQTHAGDMTEADLERIDREYGILRDSGALERQRVEHAQELELARMPNGGYLHG